MIAVRWPAPFLTAHSERLERLTTVPQDVRSTIETYTSGYETGRVVGGTLSPALVAAGRVLVSAAEDYADLARLELAAIPEQERAQVWRQAKELRKAEAQKEGVTQ